jgi:hypothetical protein
MAENNNDTATVNQIVSNTRELLEKQFKQAYFLRDESGKIRISFAHEIGNNEFGELIAISKISFGKKVKDLVEHAVDVTQTQLDLKEGKPE